MCILFAGSAILLSVVLFGLPVGMGFPFLVLGFVPLLLIPMVIFPIIGGLKANEGTAWKYPLSIEFFK
jgi:uncharacterized Tic20 family protein